MDMEWTSIIDGDLSGIPKAKLLIFTVYNEDDEKTCVIPGWVSEYTGRVCEETVECIYTYDAKNVKAWMEFPEPYKPAPHKCFKCNHGHLQHDEDSDNWFECELLQRDVPANGKPNDCPLR